MSKMAGPLSADLRGSRPVVFLLIYLLGFGLCLVLLGLPLFQKDYPSGFFAAFWCMGILSWLVRLVRSRKSQFSILSVLGVITFAAAIFAFWKVSHNLAEIGLFVILFGAITGDVAVRQSDESGVGTTALQLLQALAGLTGLARITRGIFHEWFV